MGCLNVFTIKLRIWVHSKCQGGAGYDVRDTHDNCLEVFFLQIVAGKLATLTLFFHFHLWIEEIESNNSITKNQSCVEWSLDLGHRQMYWWQVIEGESRHTEALPYIWCIQRVESHIKDVLDFEVFPLYSIKANHLTPCFSSQVATPP